MPITCNIPDRLITVRVGPVFTKEDGEPDALTQGGQPGGLQGCEQNLCLCRPRRMPTTARPVFDSDCRPLSVSLA